MLTNEIKIWFDREDSHEQFVKKVWAETLALDLNDQIGVNDQIRYNILKTDEWISIQIVQSILNKPAFYFSKAIHIHIPH